MFSLSETGLAVLGVFAEGAIGCGALSGNDGRGGDGLGDLIRSANDVRPGRGATGVAGPSGSPGGASEGCT